MKYYILRALFLNEKNKIEDTPAKSFIYRAYNNVISILNSAFEDEENITMTNIKSINITDNMKNKLCNLIKEGASKLNQKDILRSILINGIGIGPVKADKLIKMGLKDINELKGKEWRPYINEDTYLSLKYRPLRKIPHNEIKKIEMILNRYKVVNKKMPIIITGSFRRGSPFSKDIDVVFPTNNNIEYFLTFIKKYFTISIYSRGPSKISMFIKALKLDIKRYIKMDIFLTAPDEYYTMVLYSTGSKMLNIKMRRHAKSMGLLLNQKGIFKNGKKINNKNDNEKELFKIIHLTYLYPSSRSLV